MRIIERVLILFLQKIAKCFLYLQAKILLIHGKDHVFYEHIMDPTWNYKGKKNKINPYFKKYGFNYSCIEGEYYKQMTGIESDLYIPQSFFYYYLVPFLNKAGYTQDKNLFRRLLLEGCPNNKVKFIMPRQVVYNMGGENYLGNNETCTLEDAIEAIMSFPNDIIVKPTTNTTWGRGVIKLSANEKTYDKVRKLLHTYKKDFSFEERIIQHPDLATFNESSLNTIRIVTYRKLSGEIKYLYSLLRFGEEGSIVDNASAGGRFVSLSEDGVVNRVIKQYKSQKTDLLSDKVVDKIPFFKKVKDTTLYLHTKLPTLNYIGWDMSVTEDGTPVLIEFNSKPAVVGKQISSGPIFSQEDLDEIMSEIAKWKIGYDCHPVVYFPERKGYKGEIKY